jgi:hypothetical protein
MELAAADATAVTKQTADLASVAITSVNLHLPPKNGP